MRRRSSGARSGQRSSGGPIRTPDASRGPTGEDALTPVGGRTARTLFALTTILTQYTCRASDPSLA
ncbi:MAG: hypothetical protein CHACPFDD_03858 [Phycisphaerae bacterium]|nr:hypothetical protein [Phycisphaerae bacterium]